MRLLNTATLNLHEFIGDKIPPYAILSHTWGEEEVSLQEMQSREATGIDIQKAGYQKIKKCCKTSATDGYEYVWIDTCCIDKTSSAELSEAINSMFRWYKMAEVCYSFLSDCPSGDHPTKEDSAFARSRWFTRGWTLQELIAPTNLIFFNRDWVDIGTRCSLREKLTPITGIHSGVFAGRIPSSYSIAQRMSWASRRQTTRIEDTAYCLMGIFGINMPMLYGEGGRAFMRLQEEILRTTEDQTIFAWRSDSTPSYGYSLLASHPSAFTESSSIEVPSVFGGRRHTPISFSNGHIQVQLPVTSAKGPLRVFLAVLDCTEPGEFDLFENYRICIFMVEQPGSRMGRINTNILEMIKTAAVSGLERITIYNKVTVYDQWQPRQDTARFSCRLDNENLLRQGIALLDFAPRVILRTEDKTLFQLESDTNKICAMRFQDKLENTFDILIKMSEPPAFHTLYAVIGQDNSSRSISDTLMCDHPYHFHLSWSPNSDRLVWHWKSGNMWILVTIKKCVEDRGTRYVVHLSSRELDRSTT
jgi:hypothetical protein